MPSLDEKRSLFTKILQLHKDTEGFENSDLQRHLLSYPSHRRLEDEFAAGGLLGEGGNGTVKAGYDIHKKKDGFVVKTIHMHTAYALAPNYSNFSVESFSMEYLRGHSHIIEIKDVFFDHNNDTMNLVMERAAKGSLDGYILRRWDINPELDVEADTKHIAHQGCDALAFMHARGIVHCDFKPENVLIVSYQPTVIIKVADFGAAQIIGKSGFLTSRLGTARYMAPERANPTEANGGFNDRVDSWSMGAVVHSMLRGGQSHVVELPSIGRPWLPEEVISRQEIDWEGFDSQGEGSITEIGQEFVKALLRREPDLRLSITGALKHKWFSCLDAHTQSKLSVGSTRALGHSYFGEKKFCTTDTTSTETDVAQDENITIYGVHPEGPSSASNPLASVKEESEDDVDMDIVATSDPREAMEITVEEFRSPSISQELHSPRCLPQIGTSIISHLSPLCEMESISHPVLEASSGTCNTMDFVDWLVGTSRPQLGIQRKPRATSRLQVAARKSARFRSSADSQTRGIRRSPRLQSMNQNRQERRPYPYSCSKSGPAVNEYEEGYANSRRSQVQENEGQDVVGLLPGSLLNTTYDLLQQYGHAQALNVKLHLIARKFEDEALKLLNQARLANRLSLYAFLMNKVDSGQVVTREAGPIDDVGGAKHSPALGPRADTLAPERALLDNR